MKNSPLTNLTLNDEVFVKTIDGVFRIGTIIAFGEHTVIVCCGAYRYVARKEELIIQGYKLPPYKKKIGDNFSRTIVLY
ncbi:hypothetical protein IGI39_003894 [Enterococcus sp. AZ135]|uniref:hypothetical protein n=1 Tax=unclassified Enterococcus TaxID=2608891 RepID=UPI003F230F2A